jgi:lipopolysaccharide export system protein LptA
VRSGAFPHAIVLAALLLGGTAATAQTPGTLTHDTSQPINVSADRLEVREDGKTAVFSGHVEAVQGDMKLTASEIRVYYRPGSTSGTAGKGGNTSQFITRIDATGDVAIETPQESAKGDWAIYDVDQNILTLGGSIEITRGENKVQGQRLVLDMGSGRTQIESGDGTGRVKGTFSPSDVKGQGDKSESGAPARPAP